MNGDHEDVSRNRILNLITAENWIGNNNINLCNKTIYFTQYSGQYIQ